MLIQFYSFTLLGIIFASFLVKAETKITCKDESGNEVDWFFAYKLPKDPKSSDENFKEGSAYFIMTPSNPIWQRSSKKIDDPESILAMTIGILYEKDSSDLAYVLFNDQPPKMQPMVRNGHTKGLVLASSSEGIFLQHSVPHFPFTKSEGSLNNYYPRPGGLENGQMFLCLSFKSANQVDSLGEALQYTKPDIYEYEINDQMALLLPKLTDVVRNNATKRTAPWYTTLNLQAGALDFRVFVKGPKFRKEIYGDWIAPNISSALDVQSWLLGSHPIASNCNSTFVARNVQTKEINNEMFTNVNDHSKWAVATQAQNPWICVGDLNRMKPQKSRGGLALCTSNPNLWNAFKSSVLTLEPCPASRNPSRLTNHHHSRNKGGAR